MQLIIAKTFAAIFIFSTSMIAGLLAICLRNAHGRSTLIQAFISGVFLGTGLFHLLPEAEVALNHRLPHMEYPYAHLLCAAAMITFFFIEKASNWLKTRYEGYPITAYLLVMLLSYHSIVAGAALGSSTTFAAALIIFTAIIAHKGLASFAMTTKLSHSHDSQAHNIALLVLFSLMTPLGILTTAAIGDLLQTPTHRLLEGVFSALAAGTFLYLGIWHNTINRKSTIQANFWAQLLANALGITAMALVSWIHA